MEEVFLDRVVLSSANGKFRIRLEVSEDGSLLATLLLPDPKDATKWEAQHSGAGIKLLARTRPDQTLGVINLV